MKSERLLPEVGELSFGTLTEIVDFTGRLQEKDTWKRVGTNELRVLPISDNPLSLFMSGNDNEKERLGLQEYDDDVVLECMENEGCVISLPKSEGGNIPVRYTAIRGIRDRAGINGPVFNRLNRYENADILNTALRYWGSQCLVLVRDQKVTAVHSGDAGDYSVLPQGDLFRAFREGLSEMFGEENLEFSGGFVGHELSGCDVRILHTTASRAFARAFALIGESLDGMEPCIRLRVSDIATNGANLYPILKSPDREIQVGSALKLTHKYGHGISDFSLNLSRVMSLYRDGADRMNALSAIPIRDPEGCIRNAARKLGLPKRYITGNPEEPGAADLLSMYGADKTNAFEVYYYLFSIVDMMARKGLSGREIFNMQENISRALYLDWAELDCACEW